MLSQVHEEKFQESPSALNLNWVAFGHIVWGCLKCLYLYLGEKSQIEKTSNMTSQTSQPRTTRLAGQILASYLSWVWVFMWTQGFSLLGGQIGTDKSRSLSLVLVCKETRGLTPKKESGKIIGIPRRFFRKKKKQKNPQI